jgi:putative membrane protein
MTADLPINDIARAWSFPPWPSGTLILTGAIYLRGWWRIRTTRSEELPPWRAIAFCCGLAAIWLVLASPIDALDDFLLLAHMTQHLVLMSVGPPLLVLGAPTVPLLQGLPRVVVRHGLGRLLRQHWLHAITKFLTHPVFGWLSMNLAYLGWHVPAAYELTLHSEPWHNVEHICFLLTSIAFWWTVIEPWPSRSPWSRWAVLPYLVTADLVNTGISAFLSFCGRVLYPSYAEAPRLINLSPLNDQIAAGAEMWVLGSTIFLIPAMIILHQLFTKKEMRPGRDTRKVERETVGK